MTKPALAITAAQLLALDEIAPGRFQSRHSQTNHTGSLYGGQFIGQALAAAVRTTPGKSLNSMHGYFLRPGSPDAPIDYEVEPLRDGRRAASRRVSAFQDGKLAFHLHCSFVAPLDGFEHQVPPDPAAPRPEALDSLSNYVAAHAAALSAVTVASYCAPFPLELRLVEPERSFFELLPEPRRAFWVRMPSAAGIHDPALHQCLLAFASDYWLAGVGAGAHVLPTDRSRLQIASLDHAMWFHRSARADRWMLYVTDSPSAQEGRALCRGLLYDEAGALVATTAQEALLLPT
jgi:acyl-CoA thioesterase-2